MKGLKTTTISILAVGLLAGSAVGVAAQDAVDSLPGLVTEEIEPGVLRLVSDGQRDLSRPVEFNGEGGVVGSRVVAAPDGSVWIFRPEVFFRLGDESLHAGNYWGGVVDVDGDGQVWALGGDLEADSFDVCRNYGRPHLVTFDGNEWTAKLCNVLDFQLHPDGSPLVIVEQFDDRDPYPGHFAVGRVRDRAWEKIIDGQFDDWEAMPLLEGFRGFAMRQPSKTDDPDHDSGWLVDGAGELQLFNLSPDGGGSGGPNAEGDVVALGFGSDHTSWAYLRFEEASVTDGSLTTEETYLLARFPPMLPAGFDQYPERMDVFESELDPRSLLDTCCGIAPRLDVAPDGSVWLPSDLGLARFDGETWDWYLEGHPIEDIDIASDGTVWVQANDVDKSPGVAYWEQDGTTATYVITPEAVAATE